MSVYPLIMIMVDQFASVAWQKMGLQPDPMTGKIHQDLEEARVAIDVAVGLAAFLKEKLDDDDQRRIDSLVRDLRMNFVNQSSSGGASNSIS